MFAQRDRGLAGVGFACRRPQAGDRRRRKARKNPPQENLQAGWGKTGYQMVTRSLGSIHIAAFASTSKAS